MKKNLRTPQIVNDLYADLRDRRLLIPAVALVVALVAVPVVLGGGGSTASSAPAAAPVADAADAAAVEPAVLAENTGIRDYRKRLEQLKEKNPFAQKFALPTAKSVELKPESSGGETSGLTSGGVTSASSDASSALDSAASSISSGVDSSTGTSSAGSSASGSVSAEPPKPVIRFYSGRVDVRFGPNGDTKVYEGLRRLDFLPDDKSAMIAFIGLAEGGDHAIFSLSSDVTETSGDGACAPKNPSPCQFLNLKIGQERELTCGPDGTTYRLKLVETHFVRVPDPRDK